MASQRDPISLSPMSEPGTSSTGGSWSNVTNKQKFFAVEDQEEIQVSYEYEYRGWTTS
jgi:hypothetical protein